jgi:hypothetical protein
VTLARKIVLHSAAAACGAALALYSPTTPALAHRAANNLPTTILWAWERPEDLRFLDPQQTGVAFLAKTIELSGNSSDSGPRFTVRPRLQPLRLAAGTPLVAVVRIEVMTGQSRPQAVAPAIASPVRDKIASEIAALQNISSVHAIQIDFDATASQHPFYSTLLQEVRRQLRPEIPLSITALASWCLGDTWLAQLPPGTIDEAVPMLFRMGPDTATIARFLHSGEEFPVTVCQSTLGLSTDEPISRKLLTGRSLTGRSLTGQSPAMQANWRQKRVYVFAPHPWTPSAVNSIHKDWQP